MKGTEMSQQRTVPMLSYEDPLAAAAWNTTSGTGTSSRTTCSS
jgi:hypothetical protein